MSSDPEIIPVKQENKTKPTLKSFLQKLGPGFITAALVFGPGSLTINTKLGASFGYNLLWVIVLAIVLMMAFTTMSIKIGLFGNQSFIERIRTDLGKPLALIVGLGVFLVTASFQAGNTVGVGVAFSEIFNSSLNLWVSLFSIGAILLLFFRSFYKILEKLMISLVILMLISFLLTIIMSVPDIGAVAKGLIPRIPKGSEYLIITLTASSFSIVGAFYQSYLVREKGWTKENVKEGIEESRAGIIILGLLSTMVMIAASAVLKGNSVEVKSAADLGMALEPLFGPFTSKVFMIGFFAASFSSMIGNATIGGVILSDTFFHKHDLSSINARSMIAVVIIIGAIVAMIFGSLPLELIIFAQGITIMIVPVTAIIILLFANSAKAPEELRNNRYLNTIGVAGILILLIMSVFSIQFIYNVLTS